MWHQSMKRSCRPSQGGNNTEDEAPGAAQGCSPNALLPLRLHPARAAHLGHSPAPRSDGGAGPGGGRPGLSQAQLPIAPDSPASGAVSHKLQLRGGEPRRFGSRNPSSLCARKTRAGWVNSPVSPRLARAGLMGCPGSVSFPAQPAFNGTVPSLTAGRAGSREQVKQARFCPPSPRRSGTCRAQASVSLPQPSPSSSLCSSPVAPRGCRGKLWFSWE